MAAPIGSSQPIAESMQHVQGMFSRIESLLNSVDYLLFYGDSPSTPQPVGNPRTRLSTNYADDSVLGRFENFVSMTEYKLEDVEVQLQRLQERVNEMNLRLGIGGSNRPAQIDKTYGEAKSSRLG